MLGIHQAMPGNLSQIPIDAKCIGAETFQVFLRNNRNMKRRNYTMDDINAFNYNLLSCDLSSYVIHASYAMNPCTDNVEARERYVKVIREDLTMLQYMAGTPYYVLHPGSSKELSFYEAVKNLCTVLKSIVDVIGKTHIAIEFMAGAGTQIISTIEQAVYCMTLVADIPNVCLCFDTCHVFAAGCDLFEAFNALEYYTGVYHINNSLTAFGSHSDRHANITSGRIHEDVMLSLIKLIGESYPELPMILETPGNLLLDDFNLVNNILK